MKYFLTTEHEQLNPTYLFEPTTELVTPNPKRNQEEQESLNKNRTELEQLEQNRKDKQIQDSIFTL